ncbi:hypothetical protein [Deinococcus apachensis]|uniref:hypothetical protein n=1 Tax=Deinococcus apachensis TaxID=309886 RepID=UPI00035E925A|nr:hypothetical protein [Deinococcus apachensis]
MPTPRAFLLAAPLALVGVALIWGSSHLVVQAAPGELGVPLLALGARWGGELPPPGLS